MLKLPSYKITSLGVALSLFEFEITALQLGAQRTATAVAESVIL